MPRLRVRLPHAEAQSELSVQLGVGEEEGSAAVEGGHNRLIDGVSALVTETNQVQRNGRGELKILVVADPAGELLCEFNVAADVVL